jgi:hypothetical protein
MFRCTLTLLSIYLSYTWFAWRSKYPKRKNRFRWHKRTPSKQTSGDIPPICFSPVDWILNYYFPQQPPRAPPAEPTAAERARQRDLFQPDTPSPESSIVSSWEDLHSGISAPPLNSLSPGKRFNLFSENVEKVGSPSTRFYNGTSN